MTHIQQRRDPAATWSSVNPILYDGEVGWERDTGKSKLGDGVTAWTSLAYSQQKGDPGTIGSRGQSIFPTTTTLATSGTTATVAVVYPAGITATIVGDLVLDAAGTVARVTTAGTTPTVTFLESIKGGTGGSGVRGTAFFTTTTTLNTTGTTASVAVAYPSGITASVLGDLVLDPAGTVATVTTAGATPTVTYTGSIKGAPGGVTTVAGRSGAVTLAVADVSGAAPLADPVFTGNPTAPTPTTGDSDTSVATTAFVQAAVAAVLLQVYPVGSVYMSVSPTSPATMFGGTWAVFGAGRGVVSLDSTNAAKNTPEQTGGNASGTVTLTAAQMAHSHSTPNHTHTDNLAIAAHSEQTNTTTGGSATRVNAGGHSLTGGVTSSGASTTGAVGIGAPTPIDVQDPFIVAYVWKRTA